MTLSYWWAAEVERVARPLISDHHQHLQHLSKDELRFMFRSEAASKNGKATLGKASKVAGRTSFLANPCAPTVEEEAGEPEPFFLIEIAHDHWDTMSDAQRQALVDHELEHCKINFSSEGTPTKIIAPHDLEEFTVIVERHGLWKRDVEDFVTRSVRSQPSLFDQLAEAPTEDPDPDPEPAPDDLFDEARRLVIEHETGSASMLQRRLHIEFGRAQNLINALERAGVVGPPAGAKPRPVLIAADTGNVIQLRQSQSQPQEATGTDTAAPTRLADPGAAEPIPNVPHDLSPLQGEPCSADTELQYDHRDCQEDPNG